MDSSQNSNAIDILRGRVNGVYRRMRFLLALRAFSYLLIFSAACAGLCIAVGAIPSQPSRMLRYPTAIFCAAGILSAISYLLYRVCVWRQTLPQIARFIETRLGNLDNKLINPLLLAGDGQNGRNILVDMNIRQCARETQKTDLLAALGSIKKNTTILSAGACGFVLLAAVGGIFFSGLLVRGAKALTNPESYVPSINTLKPVSISPQDKTIFAGSDVDISVTFRSNEDLDALHPARVAMDNSQTVFMTTEKSAQSFSAKIKQVQKDFGYAVIIADNRWPAEKKWFRVKVIRNIRAESITQTITPPAYTKLEVQKITSPEGMISVPLGSEVALEVVFDNPVPDVRLEKKSGEKLDMQKLDACTFAVSLAITGDDFYRLALLDENKKIIQQFPGIDGEDSPAPDGWLAIRAIPDDPPVIKISSPARDISASPGDTVEITIQSQDKYVIGEMKLFWKNPDGKTSTALSKQPHSKTAKISYTHKLNADTPADSVIEYFAQASDTRNIPALDLGPQAATSRKFKITVQNSQKITERNIASYKNLKSLLMEILNRQLAQRVNTSVCMRLEEVEKITPLSLTILAGQRDIEKRVAAMVTGEDFSGGLFAIRNELSRLAANELATAVLQAQILSSASTTGDSHNASHALAQTQDNIIQSLRTLLAIMGEFADPKTLDDPGSPHAQREKLADLAQKLKEFQGDISRAIEDTSKLPPTPKDNFTPADEKLLADIKANLDKWEKFLTDAFSDFSKLRMQDFSNPQMLEELLSVRCDVTMAKDSLNNKAREIATAMEDNALENASSLTANLEKWLPDIPDREKWAMEAPDTFEQENIEMPNLPSQLEDLMGELIEQEEDLFDQMQDITSKATASLDKGAGWDTLDGPISSMNAQGVTGNQLPNSSEIQGRSGEGRSGKAAGEHVEDKAVGKGGRRTPTRLTPEPYQAGQVKDSSGEPPGVATGGGKLSGSGSRGLQGPQAPPTTELQKRLEGRQAELINKAAKVRLTVQANNLANLRMLKSIILMNRVNNNIRSGNYINALRMREGLMENLHDSSVLISGELEIRADSTSALPKHIRDDISNGKGSRLPAEFENILREYYKKISK